VLLALGARRDGMGGPVLLVREEGHAGAWQEVDGRLRRAADTPDLVPGRRGRVHGAR
jgi:hypothetical protein